MNVSAAAAFFAGWKSFAYPDQDLSFPFCFISNHIDEHSPSVIGNRFSKTQSLFYCRHIQIFDPDDVIFFCDLAGQFMKKVGTLMLGFRMQFCDFLTLSFIIS